ncbi:sensor histidine kinase [Psychroserpens sp.]|uniref:sensor histidine kinase n=1 Tax=Psychroserpens sp. TaxID=2020870 RepID=UPI002B2712E6|nr:ATP-binding protein [Psychroserpens sp.]
MSSTRLLLLLFFTLLASFAPAQNSCNCDSNISLGEREVLKYSDSVEIFNTIEKLEIINNAACSFEALNFKFHYYCSEKKVERAYFVLEEQEKLSKKMSCKNQVFDIYFNKALYYNSISDFEKLSEFGFKALKEAEKLKDVDKEIEVIKQIVHLFTRMKEKSKKWEYVQRAEKLILNHKTSINNKVSNYAWLVYEFENEYTIKGRETLIDSALNFIKEVKSQAIDNKLYHEVARLYRASEAFSYHKGELNEALVYIDSAIFYAKKIKGYKNMSGFYLSKSWDHLDLKQYENASKWIDSALFYDDKTDIAGHMMLLSQAAEIYESSGTSNKALSSLKIYTQLKDSIMSKQRSKIVNELETKYQTEIKDAQIKRLSIWLILTSLGIVSLLFITTLIRLRQSRKQNDALRLAFDKQIKLEKELSDVRDEIAQDFHDDLGNKLARISLLSNLISGEVSIDDPKVKSKIRQITEDANGLYKGTRDFVFSLKSNSDYIEEIATYLSDFGEDFFEKTKVKFVVKKAISTNDKLPHYWNKQLVFIFKEALTNTLKHSKCDQVTLSFIFKNNTLTVSCIDNGLGISNLDIDSSNGLSNMKNRAKKIGGLLRVDSELGIGTTITFIGNINEI